MRKSEGKSTKTEKGKLLLAVLGFEVDYVNAHSLVLILNS